MKSFKGRFTRKQIIAASVSCVAGTMLNVILSTAADKIGLPLYLDTVGTISVAILYGYIPGMVVGAATNIVRSFSDVSALYYAVLNVSIAVVARWAAERGLLRNVKGVIAMIIAFSLLGGYLGAMIPWCVYGIPVYDGRLCGILYDSGHFSYGTAFFIASILSDFPDKAVSVLLALGIVRVTKPRLEKWYGEDENTGTEA